MFVRYSSSSASMAFNAAAGEKPLSTMENAVLQLFFAAVTAAAFVGCKQGFHYGNRLRGLAADFMDPAEYRGRMLSLLFRYWVAACADGGNLRLYGAPACRIRQAGMPFKTGVLQRPFQRSPPPSKSQRHPAGLSESCRGPDTGLGLPPGGNRTSKKRRL